MVSLLPQALYLSLAFQCGGTAALPDPWCCGWLEGEMTCSLSCRISIFVCASYLLLHTSLLRTLFED